MVSKFRGKITSIISILIMISLISLIAAGCSSRPTSTPTAKTTPSPSPLPPISSPTPTKDVAALKAMGEELYQKTAGGIGCKTCHGVNGKGIPNTAEDVRGASADDIKRALGGDAMGFISLTEEEIEAISTYLKSLESQP